MQTGHGAMFTNDCLDRDFCFDFPALLDQFVSSLRRVFGRNINEEELVLLIAINPG